MFFTRYITRDELRQAMTQHGMGDEATIDEILDDVDTDKVITLSSVLICSFFSFFLFLFINEFCRAFCMKKLSLILILCSFYVGRKDQL